MPTAKRTLAYRLLVPLFAVIAVVTAALIILIARISDHIIDDYHRYVTAGHAVETKRVLDRALAELTTARLLDNPTVAEVKKRQVLDALALEWGHRRLEGVVTDSAGGVLLTTLPEDLTSSIGVLPPGPFRVESDGRELHGESAEFPAWGWKVATAARTNVHQFSRKEVAFLVPIVLTGSLLMVGALLLLLRKNLQQPVAAMVDAVRSGRDVAPTGVIEFDQIGSAMNDALRHVREKEERISLLLRSAAEGVYGVDTQGVCIFCNPAALRMLGYEHEQELLGKVIYALIHHHYPDGRSYPDEDCRIYQAYRSNQGVHEDGEVYWRKDGSSFPVEYWSYPMIDGDLVKGAVVTFIDITERHRAEAVLREEKNKFEAIVAAIGEGISIQDRSYRVLYQNEHHKQLVGDHTGELCHQAFRSLHTVCPECPVARSFSDGQVHTVERVRDLTTGTRHLEITSSPLRNAAGEIVAGIELVRDVTQRYRTEAQLRQAQKMEAIGQLAGGIAHDFNNILTAITGYSSFIKVRTDAGSQLRGYADQVLLAAEKAANLTRQILAFSRKQVLAPRPVRVNDLVRGMDKILLRLLGEEIDVRMELAAEDTTVMADPGQVEQVILNLATNARDAMPAGGTLAIRTENVVFDAEGAASKGLARPGRYCLATFSDTGQGMTDQVRHRIFEPFFTTKELGRGTGLGLSIVYGIVTQHEGQIFVYSEPGQGTTFRIYLPLAAGPAEIAAGPEPAAVPGGTETLLLAEDDEQVRKVIRLLLEDAGYRVIEAADGEDAVNRFREHRDQVRLCVLDIVMPRRNGKEALAAMRVDRPDLPAVFMSGYAADIIRAKDLAAPDLVLVNKPVDPMGLLRTIRQVLDKR